MNVILIDAKNALYRYGYAHANLTNEDDEPTGAIFGIVGCLLRLKKKYPNSRFVMVWDGEGANDPKLSWRKRLFPAYKANRKQDKELTTEVKNIFRQITELERMCDVLQIKQIKVKGVEADDTIGILVKRLLEDGYEVVVYSSDKDFYQLVGKDVIVVGDMQNKLTPIGPVVVKGKFGCELKDVLKTRALLGDTSDNIPRAIKGCGEVGVSKLISAGLDPSVETFDKLSAVVQSACSSVGPHWEDIRRNYELMKILESEDDLRLSSGQRAEMGRKITSVSERMGLPVKKADLRTMTDFFGRLGISSVMNKRSILVKLNKDLT